MSLIIKDQIELKPIYHRIPKLETLNLSQVENSYVRCRLCRGQKVVAIKSDTLRTFTFKHCLLCEGRGIMSNRESDYDSRE